MKQYLQSMAKLFSLVTMYKDRHATAILSKQLELSMESVAALEHWNKNKGELYQIADMLVIQDVSDYLEERVRQ